VAMESPSFIGHFPKPGLMTPEGIYPLISMKFHEYILFFNIPIKLIHNIGIFLDYPMKNIPFFIPKNVDG
jgi:hypothetical protein